MLAAHELARLRERLGLSPEARAVIDAIRSSPPARSQKNNRLRKPVGSVSHKLSVRTVSAVTFLVCVSKRKP